MSKIIDFIKKDDSSLILLNKDLYYKILFVDSDNTDLIFTTVDNNENFSTLLFESKGFAYSFNVQSFFYRHNLIDEIFFLVNVLPFYNKYRLLLNKLNLLLFCLEKFKSKKQKTSRGLIFTKAVRGGFKCMYIGIRGFLPRKYFSYVFLNLISKKFLRSKYFATLFSKSYYSNLFQRICCSFIIKIRTFNFYNRQQSFVKRMRKLKKRKIFKLSIVFLLNDICKNKYIDQKKYERKKRNKKTVYKKHAQFLLYSKKSR